MKEEGITILFVSHKLDEVFEISDSITILRSGENVLLDDVTVEDIEKELDINIRITGNSGKDFIKAILD